MYRTWFLHIGCFLKSYLLVLLDRVWECVRMRAFFLKFSMYMITSSANHLDSFLNLETCYFIFALGEAWVCMFPAAGFGSRPLPGWRTSFPSLMYWMPFLWRDVRFCQIYFCVVDDDFFGGGVLYSIHVTALAYFHLLESVNVLFMLFFKLQARNVSYWQSTWLPCIKFRSQQIKVTKANTFYTGA